MGYMGPFEQGFLQPTTNVHRNRIALLCITLQTFRHIGSYNSECHTRTKKPEETYFSDNCCCITLVIAK